jgi:MFS transporter, FSR family, fosmidomycin resistance protein
MKVTPFTSTAISSDAITEIAPGHPAPSSKRTEISSADKPGTFQRGSVYLIASGHFVNDTYTGFLSPLLPLLMERLQFPLSRAGMLASVLSASTSLLQPIFGALNDRFGKRFFVFLGPLITGFFICSLGYAPSYQTLIPLLLLCGLGSAMFHPSAAAMVSRVSGQRKEWGMSLFITAGNIGYAMSSLFVVPVVMALGFRATHLLILPSLVVALMLFRRLPQPRLLPVALKNFLGDGDARRQRKSLLLHLVISMLRSVMITGFGTFIPVYMRSRGHSFFSSGATVTIFQSIGAIGSLLSGHFAARVDRRRIIIFTLWGATPLLVSFVYFPGWLALVALALSGILLYFSFPLNIVMSQELFPHRASMVSALMIGVSWGTAGLMMTPLGFIAEQVGLQTALLALPLIGLAAGGIASFLPKEQVKLADKFI